MWKDSPWLGTVKLMVQLAKGRYDECPKYHWFYSRFPGRHDAEHVKDAREVVEWFRNAWWVEEEDIEQELWIILWRYNLVYKRPKEKSMRSVAQDLRNIMIFKSRCFYRSFHWQVPIEEAPESSCSAPQDRIVALHELSPLHRYMLYAKYWSETMASPLAKILGVSENSIWLNSEIEEAESVLMESL